MNPFQFAGTPAIHFGSGMIRRLTEILPQGTRHILFVAGSFQQTNAGQWQQITAALAEKQMTYDLAHIHQEPTVAWVDETVQRFGTQAGRANVPHNRQKIDAVVAIGGGSALDAGKAVSAMLCAGSGESVRLYLEGQPDFRPHSGMKVPFIAVPTTSGTGSEMTKNAVISLTGGFKRSIRHDRFIPDAAIVDAALTVSCAMSVKAASGLDALTQLIESYVSTKATPLTDALALSGIAAAAKSLVPICTTAAANIALHEQMAYAAMLSGITLAHAGLGLVHGFAGPLGGCFPIPHGVICGTLLAEVTKRSIAQLRSGKTATAEEGLAKYAKAGALLTGGDERDTAGCCDRLTTVLAEWTTRLQIPRLGRYGVNAGNIDGIIAAADHKQSPAPLDRAIMREILLARI